MEEKMHLHDTDPEFMERWEAFAYEEVVNEENQQLDETTRYLAILAVLLGTQSVDAYRYYLPKAVEAGVTPVMVKETVYQATDYLGFGKVLPFLTATNEVFAIAVFKIRQGRELPRRWRIAWRKARRRRRKFSARR